MNICLRFLVFAVVLLLSPLAHAESTEGPREACGSDVQKFCPDDQNDPGQAKACLSDHYKEISDACYTALKSAPSDEGSGDRGGPRAACRQDVHSLCQGVQPGGGRVIDCLKDHYKQLSDACYAALNKAKPPAGSPGDQGNNGHAQ